MRFQDLSERLRSIEATTKRLEMAQRLAEVLSAADEQETRPLAYLLLGSLAPDHEGLEVGLADKMVVRLVRTRTGASDERIRELAVELGDLGLVAEKLWKGPRAGQLGLSAFGDATEPEALSVTEVHERLSSIARIEGTGSQDEKLGHALRLLDRASAVEARYLVRFLVGKLRLGVADMTLLDGAGLAYADPDDVVIEKDGLARPPASWREAMERAYNLTSDIGRVLEVARADGLAGLARVTVTTGSPVRPMLAERLTSLAEVMERLGAPVLAELKYDGLRLQAHLDDGHVRLFSRRLEEVTAQFPDVCEALSGALSCRRCIVEGEAVPVDADTGRIRPFQDIARRRGRKHDLEGAIEAVPVHVYLFDVLMVDDEPVLERDLPVRREQLATMIGESDRVHLSDAAEVSDEAGLEAFFERSVETGGEGIMVKSMAPGSGYQAGARGYRWVKFKRDYVDALADSLDLVIVGAFHGRGRRTGWYGALLGACYDPDQDRYETVCKVGTGFTDEALAELNDVLDEHRSEARPKDVVCEMEPDVYFDPAVVAEVRGAELTRSPVHTAARTEAGGLALRFPRFLRWRADKGPIDATTTQELVALYEAQTGPR